MTYQQPSEAYAVDDSDDGVMEPSIATNDTFTGHPDPQNRAVRANLGRIINPNYESEQRTATYEVLDEFVVPVAFSEIPPDLEVPPDIDFSRIVINDNTSNDAIEAQTETVPETPKATVDPSQPTPHRSTIRRRRKRTRQNINDDSFLVDTAGDVFGRKGRRLFKKFKKDPNLVDKVLDHLELNDSKDESFEVTPIAGLSSMLDSGLSVEKWNKVII